MAGTCIMTGICTSPYSFPYLIEKVGDSSFLVPIPIPSQYEISRQNEDEFGQYSSKQIYMSSLIRSD